jgi:hypothetical protein
MTLATPPAIETFTPLVERFVDAIKQDWRVSEAMALRATSILSFRGVAGSKPGDE